MKRKILHSFVLRAVMLVALLTTAIGAWAEETLTEGFEKASTGDNYQGTVTLATTNSDCGIAWTIYYGNVCTAGKRSGNNGAQLRLYSNKNCGYMQTTTAIEGLSNVSGAGGFFRG